MTGPSRTLRAGASIAMALGLLALAWGCASSVDDRSETSGTGKRHTIAITIENGEVVDPPGRVTVSAGDEMELQVSADVAAEVHVHGYDVAQRVAPGKPATVTFVADIPGLFEAELEETHQTILELEVR